MAAHTDAGAPQPTTVLLESTIQQTSKQVAADMGGGEIAMMSVNTGKYYHLNETSARIWQLIETPCRVSDICAALQADYDVDMAECEHEVLSHLSCLVNAGMAETVAKAA